MKRAFTLIELLIVVAIIAILAAIAVPNFLEAQVRSKVARAKADIRTLALAAESYRIDGNKYPITPFYPASTRKNICQAHNWPWECGQWFILTTPIAYISSVPHDALFKANSEQWGIWQDYYRVWNLSTHANSSLAGAAPWGYPETVNFARSGGTIMIASVGPDRVEDVDDGSAGGAGIGTRGLIPYDPTNGTVSWGDIYYGMPGTGFDVSSKIWR
jgi:prepilin-type N-terminal cleavage/methylation domain-containing protein